MPEKFIRDIRDIKVGDNCNIEIVVDEKIIGQFTDLTGDLNPLHVDSHFAKNTQFEERVAHGMIVGSFVSTVVGMHLPGPGALWLSQNFEFLAPVKVGDKIDLYGEIVSKSESQKVITVKVEARNKRGLIVLKGEGRVKILEEKDKMNNKQIKEYKVLVTGASRGLGAEIVKKFAKQGAHVFLNYKTSDDKALEVQKECEAFDGTIELVKADVTTEDGASSLAKQIKDGLDVIVFNAVNKLNQVPLLEQEADDFKQAFDYGAKGPFNLLKVFLPKMVEQKFGRIVSVLSTSIVNVPPTGFSAYNVNKKSLEAITKSIAVEYGKHNICANMVSPNMLRTDLTENVSERTKQLVEAQTPLKRLASLDEIAENVVYL